MTNLLLERPTRRNEVANENKAANERDGETLHECASCRHKDRVYVTSPNGTQTAAVWRCRMLSQKTQAEVLVQPHENCFEHRSLSDYWAQTTLSLVR